jgi:hypothetical protein
VTVPDSDCTIQDMDIFHDNLVLFLRKNGTPLFCSISMPIDVQVHFLALYHLQYCCFSVIELIDI